MCCCGAGAKVNAANRYGVTPLQLAAPTATRRSSTRLLEAGADPNTALPDGETVLMTAARTGAVDAVRALLVAAPTSRRRSRRRARPR